uniref:T cell activation inhibitor, mitochondrial n=1 Tax=Sus scrofa TaxID=9823 RepID=A0A8D0ZYW6_PIG
MFCHLRPMRRLCLGKIFPYWFLCSRALSGAEAVNALRPFYFAVHPDFFGQHPREREVNENSLKRLSAYLENLQKPGSKSLKPTQLMFYVRETDQNSSEGQEHFTTSVYLLNISKARILMCIPSLSRRPKGCLTGPSNGTSPTTPLLDSKTLMKTSSKSGEWKQPSRCTIIFTDRSGMSAVGHVMLGTMDVHHHWTKLFERLPSYFDLQRRLMLLEDQISYLLGGIQVVYIEELQPVLTLEEYYSLLDVFYNRLSKSRIPFHPRSLRGLQMILNSDRYAPSLHELGHFNIPTLCDLANLQWFILTKAQQARENMKRKEELKVMEHELMQASTKKFSLEKFYKEPSVSSMQMVDCCQRLLEQSLPYLQGMHLCVSHFYSVMQDGDLCIPWNWKSGEAIK